MTKEGEEFYKKLDQDKGRPGNCSCVGLSVIFVAFLVLIELGIFSFANNLRSSPSLENPSYANIGVNENFSIVDMGDGKINIVVQESVLCAKIISNLNGKNQISCLINSDGISISGKVSIFTPQNTSALLVPEIDNGNLVFKTKEGKIGKLNAPSFITGVFSRIASKAVNTAIPKSNEIVLANVSTQEAIMLLQATQKEKK